MKKIYLLFFPIFLFFGVSIANAQNDTYFPLVQEGKVWNVLDAQETYSPYPIQNFNYQTFSMFFFGDTIINDVLYKKMYSTAKETTTFPQDWSLHSFMREDENKKIWYKDKNANSAEKLYYDFSLEIGDTVPSEIGIPIEPVIVENITTEIMDNGEERKVFWLSSFAYKPFDSFREYWIEGIGSIVGLIYPLHGGVVGGFWNLLCLHENEKLIFFNQDWNTCYKNSLGISTYYDSQINIYPNPAYSTFQIKGIDNFENITVSIYNVYGQCVMQEQQSNSDGIIHIETLIEGVYFVNISSKDNIVGKCKLVKIQ